LHFEEQLAFLYVVAELGVNADNPAGREGDYGHGAFDVGRNGAGGVNFGFLLAFTRNHKFEALGLIYFYEGEIRVLLDDLDGGWGGGGFVYFGFGAGATESEYG
jgi:hypothetical protein